MSNPLCGLILAGGRSRRMGKDKATLSYYDGKTQLEVVCELLKSVDVMPYVSFRDDQTNVPECAHGVVRDAFGEAGPLGAIASAQQQFPDSGWLVVACDLPLLDAATLNALISHRSPDWAVVSFSSEHDGRPEPLCAIWESASAQAVLEAVKNKKLCARHLLEDAELAVRCLDPVVSGALDNANSPEDADEIRRKVDEQKCCTVVVRYFGILGVQAGVTDEELLTNSRTLADLYLELSVRRELSLPLSSVRVAVGDEFVPWATVIDEGADIVFMPPFCGG